VNARLADGIAAFWAQPVPETFHARYSARRRFYRYVLLNHPVRPAALSGRIGWFHLPLDADLMREAARLLIGEHDFSAFRSSECQASSPVRTLDSIHIERHGVYVVFEFCANAFLHHMVRNLMGTLVYVGKKKYPPEWAGEVLASRSRSRAAPTFDPAGLYLTAVEYDPEWGLPILSRDRALQALEWVGR
jgi:tRNA pseudouridine38-40 synthase